MQTIKKLFAVLFVMLAMLFAPFMATAAVPTGVETVFTSLATDFGTVVGYGWTLFLVIIGGLALFRVVKRVFHRAGG